MSDLYCPNCGLGDHVVGRCPKRVNKLTVNRSVLTPVNCLECVNKDEIIAELRARILEIESISQPDPDRAAKRREYMRNKMRERRARAQ